MAPNVSYDKCINAKTDFNGNVNLTATLNTLKKKTGQLANRQKKPFYIGKACGTNPPENRWYQKYKGMNYAKMYVICKTDTESDALWLEDMLVKYYKNEKKQKAMRGSIDNKTGGGGGRNGNGEIGYVYLVVGTASDADLLPN